MAKIKIQGNASGTGVITLIAPNTNTDRTVTLPDESITLGGGVDGIVSTADATAITISSSEDVGINHSTSFGTYSGTGVKYSKGDGTFFIGRDGGQPLWLNRETSQGDLIGLAAIGATKARIGIDGDDFIIKTSTGGNTERLRITDDGRGLSQFTAKAWVNFNGTGTVGLNDSHNVSSITDRGTGQYTVNFSNAMTNSDYSLGACSEQAMVQPNTYNTSNVRVNVYNYLGSFADADNNGVQVFGD